MVSIKDIEDARKECFHFCKMLIEFEKEYIRTCPILGFNTSGRQEIYTHGIVNHPRYIELCELKDQAYRRYKELRDNHFAAFTLTERNHNNAKTRISESVYNANSSNNSEN